MGIHALRHTLITGAGPTAVAAAKVGFRVKVYAYALAGAATVFEDSTAADITGIIPAGSLVTQQPDYLFVGPNDLGVSVAGGGTGFVVWAYEKVMTVQA